MRLAGSYWNGRNGLHLSLICVSPGRRMDSSLLGWRAHPAAHSCCLSASADPQPSLQASGLWISDSEATVIMLSIYLALTVYQALRQVLLHALFHWVLCHLQKKLKATETVSGGAQSPAFKPPPCLLSPSVRGGRIAQTRKKHGLQDSANWYVPGGLGVEFYTETSKN